MNQESVRDKVVIVRERLSNLDHRLNTGTYRLSEAIFGPVPEEANATAPVSGNDSIVGDLERISQFLDGIERASGRLDKMMEAVASTGKSEGGLMSPKAARAY